MLSVREAAELLRVSQKTVYRWLKDGRIPFHRLGGQYFLDRSEVNNLVIREGLRPVSAIFPEPEHDAPIALHEMLGRGGIFYRIGGTTKKEILANALSVVKGLDESVSSSLLELFLAREELAPTGIGEGIAVPHARGSLVGYVSQPVLSLSFLETPIDYGALDGKPVHALFLLISPNVRTHLRLLAKLSFALRDPECREALLTQASREAILEAFARVDSTFCEGQ